MDHHADDQVLDQLSLLLLVRLCQALPHALAECRCTQGETRDLGPPIDLGVQLRFLALQSPLPLLQLASPPPVLLQAEYATEVGRGEAFELLTRPRRSAPQDLAASSQLLRQPVAAMRPLQRPSDRLRLGQRPAEVLPDRRLQGLGGGIAGLALRAAARHQRRQLAAAAVVPVTAPEMTSHAG